MKRLKLAILFGGNSSEYTVSLHSAYSVIKHLDNKKYETILIGITRDGNWYRYKGSINNISDDTWYMDSNCYPAILSPSRNHHGIIEFHENGVVHTTIDVAFPIMHGRYGEDGTMQGLIELAGIHLVGCDTASSALCMDKDLAHKIVSLTGVKVPAVIILHGEKKTEELYRLTENLNYPLYVKPIKAGSSFGITKISKKEDLLEAVKTASIYDVNVIIEENIEGFEVGCAVMGYQDLTIGEVDEIELVDGFFDYTEKYTLKTSRIHMPARVDKDIAIKVKETAAIIYKALGCKGFARVDMFLTPKGELVFNEVNTIPGFTAHSRYPSMMKGIGLTFPEILDNLIRLAVKV
jgi:D-alanine---D-serine ligase